MIGISHFVFFKLKTKPNCLLIVNITYLFGELGFTHYVLENTMYLMISDF